MRLRNKQKFDRLEIIDGDPPHLSKYVRC